MLAGILYLGVWGMLNHQTGSIFPVTSVGSHGQSGSESADHSDGGAPKDGRAGHGEKSDQSNEAERQHQADQAKARQEAERQKQAQAQAEAQKEAQAQAAQKAEADRKAQAQAAAQQAAQQAAAQQAAQQAAAQQAAQQAAAQQAAARQAAQQAAARQQAAPKAAPPAPKSTTQLVPEQQAPARQPVHQPLVVTGGSGTSRGGAAASPSGTTVVLPRALTAPLMPYPQLAAQPAAPEESSSFPWPIVLVILGIILLTAAVGLRRYRRAAMLDS